MYVIIYLVWKSVCISLITVSIILFLWCSLFSMNEMFHPVCDCIHWCYCLYFFVCLDANGCNHAAKEYLLSAQSYFCHRATVCHVKLKGNQCHISFTYICPSFSGNLCVLSVKNLKLLGFLVNCEMLITTENGSRSNCSGRMCCNQSRFVTLKIRTVKHPL